MRSKTEPNAIGNCIRDDVRTLVENHLRSGEAEPLDTIVLGCTHFPLVQDEIHAELKRLRLWEENGSRPFEKSIAEEVAFVNPAELTAKELFRELARNRLRRTSDDKDVGNHFFISIPSPELAAAHRSDDGSLKQDYKYSRSAGAFEIEDTRYVQ